MPFNSFIATETIGERLATSGITTLIGLGMTFVILALLIGTILLMRLLLKELAKINPNFKLKKNSKEKAAPKQDITVADEKENEEKPIDKETYDAICSAVMNYTKQDGNVVIIKSVARADEKDKAVENETPAATTAPTPSLPSDGTQIKAPMPGTLLKIVAANGKQVKEGEVIFVLEAMKMENDIVSPATGTIQIPIAEGAKVNTGDLLAVIK